MLVMSLFLGNRLIAATHGSRTRTEVLDAALDSLLA